MSDVRPPARSLPAMAALILILGVGTVLLFWGGPDYHAARSTKALWNHGHILYFALATYLLLGWRPLAALSPRWRWVLMLGFTSLVGVQIEIMQYDTQRTPDLGDVVRDITGAVLMLSFGPGHAQIRARSLRYGMQMLALLMLAIQIWPVATALTDEAIARRQFPLLSGFETPFETSRWEGNAGFDVTADPSSAEGKVVQLSLGMRTFSGVHLKYFDGDWRGYRSLSLRLYNPDAQPLQVLCRIHDLAHEAGNQDYDDRFNRRFLLRQGWNDLEIELAEIAAAPKTRRLDLAQIVNLGLFSIGLKIPRTLYLDEVRLNR